MCSAEIACPQAGIIQVCLDLYESRLRGNLFEQNLLLKTVCGMMVQKGNGSSSEAQEHGLLSKFLDCPCLQPGLPMVGEVPEKQLCRKVVASAVSNTEQLLVYFGEKFTSLSISPVPHLRHGCLFIKFAKPSVNLTQNNLHMISSNRCIFQGLSSSLQVRISPGCRGGFVRNIEGRSLIRRMHNQVPYVNEC